MNLPIFLEIVIGLVFVYLVLSLLAAEIQELISTILQWRAKHLKDSIINLLSGDNASESNVKSAQELARQIYAHPALTSINQEAKGFFALFFRSMTWIPAAIYRLITGREPDFGNQITAPSYIPSSTFAKSLINQLGTENLIEKIRQAKLLEFHDSIIDKVKLITGADSKYETALNDAKKNLKDIRAQYEGDKSTLEIAINKTHRELDKLIYKLGENPEVKDNHGQDNDRLKSKFDRLLDLRNSIFTEKDGFTDFTPTLYEVVESLNPGSRIYKSYLDSFYKHDQKRRKSAKEDVEAFIELLNFSLLSIDAKRRVSDDKDGIINAIFASDANAGDNANLELSKSLYSLPKEIYDKLPSGTGNSWKHLAAFKSGFSGQRRRLYEYRGNPVALFLDSLAVLLLLSGIFILGIVLTKIFSGELGIKAIANFPEGILFIIFWLIVTGFFIWILKLLLSNLQDNKFVLKPLWDIVASRDSNSEPSPNNNGSQKNKSKGNKSTDSEPDPKKYSTGYFESSIVASRQLFLIVTQSQLKLKSLVDSGPYKNLYGKDISLIESITKFNGLKFNGLDIKSWESDLQSTLKNLLNQLKREHKNTEDNKNNIYKERFKPLVEELKESGISRADEKFYQELNRRIEEKRLKDQRNSYVDHKFIFDRLSEVLPVLEDLKRHVEKPTINVSNITIGSVGSNRSHTFSEEVYWNLGYAFHLNLMMIVNEYADINLHYLPLSVRKNLAQIARQTQLVSDDIKEQFIDFEQEVGKWFDDSMERASGVYKRNAKGIAILIGFFLAAAANASSIHVVNRLAYDSALREALVSASERVISEPEVQETEETTDSPPSSDVDNGETETTSTDNNGAGTSGAADSPPPSGVDNGETEPTASSEGTFTDAKREEIEEIVKSVELPIGWHPELIYEEIGGCPTPEGSVQLLGPDITWRELFDWCIFGDLYDDPISENLENSSTEDKNTSTSKIVSNVRRNYFVPTALATMFVVQGKWELMLLLITGWLITGIAISMGSSFWFDLLGKLVNVRNTGSKPPQQSGAQVTQVENKPPQSPQ